MSHAAADSKASTKRRAEVNPSIDGHFAVASHASQCCFEVGDE
jgi:hypothetical protein